jgi:hypothetical protein
MLLRNNGRSIMANVSHIAEGGNFGAENLKLK